MSAHEHPNIFDLASVKRTINQKQLEELITFVAQNRSFKMEPVAARLMLSSRSLSSTSVSVLFNRALELRKENVFSFMRVPPSTKAAPEIITYKHVTFDFKQLQFSVDQSLALMIRAVPEFAENIFINVTTLIRRSGEPIDVTNLQLVVVRDLLSRSYFDNDRVLWLTPSLLRYLCRFYTMSMSSSISTVYNLSFVEQQSIATVFSIYFMQRVSDADTAEVLVKSNSAALGLGNVAQVEDIIARARDVLKESYTKMSLSDACLMTSKLGIGRLESLTMAFLYSRMRNIGPDSFTSAIALEYPPYWCSLVVAVMSGRVMGLTSTFKRNDLTRDAQKFVDDLLATQSFLPAL